MDGVYDYLDATAHALMSRCTSCGKCVEACPTAAEVKLDKSRAVEIVEELKQLTGGATDAPLAAQWVEACNGSGNCSAACPEGITVRQWVGIERMRRRIVKNSPEERGAAAARRFRTMSHSVRLLASMQVPQAALERILAPRRQRQAELVFYTGCNVLRTPHIVFNVMDILEALDLEFEVMGGPGHCCGVYHYHEGDLGTYAKVAGNTYGAFAKAGAKRVLTWCPSCQKQFGETWHDYAKPAFEMGHVTKFLVEQLDRMRPKFRTDLPRQRVALHEHDGIAGVMQGVRTLIGAIPNIEVVEIEQDRSFSYNCGGPAARYPERESEVHRRCAENAAAAGVEVLLTMYHACHRQLSGAGARYPFAVKNFTDVIAEALGGGGRHDLYKQYKAGGEMDEALADARRHLADNGVTLDAATLATLSAEIFKEVGIDGGRAAFESGMQSLAGPPPA